MGEPSTPLLPSHTHEPDTNNRPEGLLSGDYAKSIVYAGLDAIVTCFSLISSISATHLSSVDVLVLGFSNLVADGISMAFGDFVSSTTERDMAVNEKAATEWEVTNRVQPQLLELLHTYQRLGMDLDDATTVVRVFSKYKDILVNEKMVANKGILPPDETKKPWKNGVVTFVSFILFGSAPLLSFIVLVPFTRSESIKFFGACVLSALALLLLGIAKAKIAGQQKTRAYVFSIAVTLANGAVAAAAAYFIGWVLRHLAGLQQD